MNRNRLLDAFISNLANVVVHKVLEKAIDKARAELNLRILRGYTNIDLPLVEKFVDEILKELHAI